MSEERRLDELVSLLEQRFLAFENGLTAQAESLLQQVAERVPRMEQKSQELRELVDQRATLDRENFELAQVEEDIGVRSLIARTSALQSQISTLQSELELVNSELAEVVESTEAAERESKEELAREDDKAVERRKRCDKYLNLLGISQLEDGGLRFNSHGETIHLKLDGKTVIAESAAGTERADLESIAQMRHFLLNIRRMQEF